MCGDIHENSFIEIKNRNIATGWIQNEMKFLRKDKSSVFISFWRILLMNEIEKAERLVLFELW